MRKIFLLFLIIFLLAILLTGCKGIISRVNDGEQEQMEGDPDSNTSSPGPAPNSGDGISDGPGWKCSFPEE